MDSGGAGRMQESFEGWLRGHGWKILDEHCDHDCVDVEAWHADGARLLAEVQEDTPDVDRDLDTAYGRLLRRMDDNPGTRYAVVVPEDAAEAALRVSVRVRGLLGVDLYAVGAGGAVRRLDG
ncbi:hypothetical protein [Streptomyces sp. NPDC001380]|uniref:hypothetical protein n=1 Tax=Streptomyces sp. NPDC001380 TaxID=3364566 RepID=UPI00367E450E